MIPNIFKKIIYHLKTMVHFLPLRFFTAEGSHLVINFRSIIIIIQQKGFKMYIHVWQGQVT